MSVGHAANNYLFSPSSLSVSLSYILSQCLLNGNVHVKRIIFFLAISREQASLKCKCCFATFFPSLSSPPSLFFAVVAVVFLITLRFVRTWRAKLSVCKQREVKSERNPEGQMYARCLDPWQSHFSFLCNTYV